MTPIPLHKCNIDEAEAASVLEVLRSGKLCGDGPVCRQVQTEMCDRFGSKHVLLTTSCTHAMELALMALEIGPSDEVICPSFTFVSTANAIVMQRAKPVFAEIREDTLNLDPDDVLRRITPRTRAILLVHYAGVSCDMDAFQRIAQKHRIALVEDAAHGIGARYRDRFLGTIGDVGCYSFHETKNLVCGEGGAFLTNNTELARKAEVMREKGTDRAAFLRGEVDKYTWRSSGSSYVLSEVLAAILRAQLGKLESITNRRKEIFRRYREGLREMQRKGQLVLPVIPPECDPNGHIFHVRVASEEIRDRCLNELRTSGIGAAFHFVPLHTSPYGVTLAKGQPVQLPITERVSRTLIRLPIHPHLSDAEVDFVISNMARILEDG